MTLDLSGLGSLERPTGAWATALLQAIARDEAAGRRPARLTEKGLATWERFKGRLCSTDLLALLFEDAAVLHPIPFVEGDGVLDVNRLPHRITSQWIQDLSKMDLHSPGADYIADQARRLGLPNRMARSELHVVKPHHKVLELPGSGGQLSYHLVTTYPDVTLQENFTIACATWQEVTLAGIVALDVGAPRTDFIFRLDPTAMRQLEHPLRQRTFDFVIGLHPDRGGLFKADDELAIWFPSARIILV